MNLKVIPDTEFLAKPPLVSVHMITYNQAVYTSGYRRGLGADTTFPIELVIGEDCSTDGTREIVFEYQRQHPDLIRLVVSDSNVGASDNSRRSLALCRGKYIAFCEGDDYWTDSYKLQKQADFLGSNPDYSLVHSDFGVYVENSGTYYESSYKELGFSPPSGYVFEDCSKRLPLGH